MYYELYKQSQNRKNWHKKTTSEDMAKGGQSKT